MVLGDVEWTGGGGGERLIYATIPKPAPMMFEGRPVHQTRTRSHEGGRYYVAMELLKLRVTDWPPTTRQPRHGPQLVLTPRMGKKTLKRLLQSATVKQRAPFRCLVSPKAAMNFL